MAHTLAILTVIYENYNVFEDFLASLRKQKNRDFHLFIADLSDNKKKLDISEIPFTLIEAENRGYAYGVNLGLQKALNEGCTKFCVMNYDTFFSEDFVDNVLSSLKNHPNSIIGGKIYYAPGYEYHQDRYTKNDLGKVLWYAGGEIDWAHATTPHTGVDEVDNGKYDTVREVTFVTGCLLCFDKSVIETVGFLDSSYFLYYEDADYSARALKKGIKIFYDPKIVLWHKVSQITEGSGSSFHQKYQDKNRVIFGLKYAPWRTKIHLLKNFFLAKINIK